MNTSTITFRYLALYLFLCLGVFLVGLNETIRNESISIAEDNFVNATSLNESYDEYLEFKSQYVFTNSPFITFMNFIGMIGILYMIRYSWILGRDSPPAEITEVFSSFNVLLIFMVYIIGIIFNYIKSILVDQLIVVLFLDIYSAIYVFRLLNEWFLLFLLVSYMLCWIANEIRYINFFNR